MIKFKDKARIPTGHLFLKIYKDNELIDTIDGNNLIVAEGSDLLGNGLITEVSDDLVQSFGVGTGSTAAASGDTRATFTSILIKSVASNVYVGGATNQLTFTFTLENSEYNGNTIKEFGLFSNGPGGSEKLFARRVLTGSIIKALGTRIEGTWVIQF